MRILGRNVKIEQRKVSTMKLILLAVLVSCIFAFNFFVFAFDSLKKHVVMESEQLALAKKTLLVYEETVPVDRSPEAKVALLASCLVAYFLVFWFSHIITVKPLPKENA